MTLVIGLHGLVVIFAAGWLLGLLTTVGLVSLARRKAQ